MQATLRTTVRRHLDEQIDSARPLVAITRPGRGWVNAIRRSLGMTEGQLAKRMGIAQSSVHGLEASEAAGTIRLDTLRRAAEALDCEVAYVLIPRRSLEETMVARSRELAQRELSRVAQSMALESQEVGVPEVALDERARDILASGSLWHSR